MPLPSSAVRVGRRANSSRLQQHRGPPVGKRYHIRNAFMCFPAILLAVMVSPAAARQKAVVPPSGEEVVVPDIDIGPAIVVDDGKRRLGATSRTPDPSGAGAPPAGKVHIGTGRFLGNAPSRSASIDKESGTYTLNLSGVTVQEAADAVLGDILKVNYTIDSKIEGRVTLKTMNPITKAGAVELFTSSLRSVGAAIVRNGDVVRVVPIDQATMGARITTSNREQPGLGNGVRVISLKYVAAAEMKRLLEPIASYGGVVRVDPSRNALLVSGSAEEIASIREAVAVFDINIMQGMSFALVPVRTLDPEDAVDNLNRAFASNTEGALSGMVQFVPNKRLRSVLIIARQPDYLVKAKAWIRTLDGIATGTTKEFKTYLLRNRQAKDVVDVLNAMFSTETNTREVRSPRPSRNALGDGPSGAPVAVADASGQGFSVGGGFAGVSAGGFGGGSPVAAAGGGISAADRFLDSPFSRSDDTNAYRSAAIGAGPVDGEPRIKIVADPTQNALLIMASASDYRRVEQVIVNLDVLPNQVLIEATIAEVALTDDLQFGVRWFFQNKSGGRSGSFTDLVNGAVGSAFPGFSFVAKAAGGQITLNALNDVTHVNVLASPSLMVLDRKTAVLQIGDQVPITTQSAQSILTPGAPIVNSVAYKDTGVILSVSPRINESGRVLLEIEQEVSTVSRTNTSNIDSPTFGRRKVKTTVLVNNGETITLGGLIQERTTESETQVPVLGDIPIIGKAFKDKQSLVEKTELVIMLTPRVVRDLNEAAAVTEEYRGRVRAFLPTRDPVRRLLNHAKRTIE
ncbi:type II secretion system protein GspD [Methylobacterium sp. V23]|nr:type II secretion system protein GspD [Methylobacterium sp. V23]